jgi:hypothetical protein
MPYVASYRRRDGTVVRGHRRSNPAPAAAGGGAAAFLLLVAVIWILGADASPAPSQNQPPTPNIPARTTHP